MVTAYMTGSVSKLKNDDRLPARRWAWALSAVMHVAVLLVIGLAWRTVRPGLQAEPDRAVGIVMAQASSNQQTEYLDHEESNVATRATASQDSELADMAVDLPEIQLPGSELPSAATQLPGDNLRGSTIADRLGGVDDLDPSGLERPVKPTLPSGPVGQVSLFGSSEASGRTFVFLVDRSKSMGGQGLNALAAAGKQLDMAIGQLAESHKYQVIAYHSKPVFFPDRTMARAIPENRARLKSFFGGLAAFGATDHELAVLAGLRVKPDVLFLLTDGGSPDLGRVQLDRIRQRSGGLTAIHCIQFGFGPLQERTPFMRKLAMENRGQYLYVDMRQR
jgi:hypothetical protein